MSPRPLLIAFAVAASACSPNPCTDASCMAAGGGSGAGGAGGGAGGGSCVPKTCADQAKDCGSLSDGCGGMLMCGTCEDPLTCGGGGTPNVCGASCATCPAGFTCNSSGVCGGGSSMNIGLDVKKHAVTGRLTLAGATPMNVGTDCAMNPTDSKAEVEFISGSNHFIAPVLCSSAMFEFSTALPAGTYYASVRGFSNTNLPFAAFHSTKLTVTAPVSNHVIDLMPSVNVTGSVTVNGAAPTKTCTGSSTAGVITFSDADKAYSVSDSFYCSASEFTFDVNLFPGTYKVTVTSPAGATNLPRTFEVSSAFNVSATTTQSFDVKKHAVSGRLTRPGATPMVSGDDCVNFPDEPKAEIMFVNGTTSVTATILCSAPGFDFDTQLSPGTWQVSVTGHLSSNISTATFNAPPLTVTGPVTGHVIDVGVPVSITGKVTVNGAAPVKSCTSGEVGRITFAEATKGYSITEQWFCGAGDFSFDVTLYPGTYKVTVIGLGTQSNLPATAEVAGAFQVSASATQDFDVKTHSVAGRLTLNGVAPMTLGTTTCIDFPNDPLAEVLLTSSTGGGQTIVPVMCPAFEFNGALAAGTYQVRVRGSGTSNIPYSEFVAPKLTVNGPVSGHVIDVRGTGMVTGRITVNGAVPMKTCTGANTIAARVSFRDIAQGYSVTDDIYCNTTDFSFQVALYPGTYRITVTSTGGVELPASYILADRVALP